MPEKHHVKVAATSRRTTEPPEARFKDRGEKHHVGVAAPSRRATEITDSPVQGSGAVRVGLLIRANPPRPEVDIIAIHGIGANSDTAWSDKGGTDSWLWTELPHRLGTSARITTYDYDSAFRTPEYLMRRTLQHQTSCLIEDITGFQHARGRLPIVFICHSLGGIVVKNALASARSSEQPEIRDTLAATYGVVFLGTPNNSSPVSLGNNICRILGVDSKGDVGRELHRRSTTLAYSLERFKPLATRLCIRLFSETSPEAPQPNTEETLPTPRVLKSIDRPPDASVAVTTARGISIAPRRLVHFSTNRDHSRLCKFSEPQDEGLKQLIGAIDEVCFQTKKKWHERERDASLLPSHPGRSQALDAMHGIGIGDLAEQWAGLPADAETPQLQDLESFFARWPDKGAPGPQHAQRQSWVYPLRSYARYVAEWLMLSSPATAKTPQDAWPVIVLSGPHAGVGTQTLLQYVRRHQDEYASVLWINACNRKSLEVSFREAARRIASAHQSQAVFALDPYVYGLGQIDLDRQHDLDDEELQTLVQAVTEWLERRHEGKWLLVLDNFSRRSPYPSPTTWPGKGAVKRRSWGELLGIIPFTTGWHGHVAISTADTPGVIYAADVAASTGSLTGTPGPDAPDVTGLKVISFDIPEAARPTGGDLTFRDPSREVWAWWQDASERDRTILALALVVSDAQCPKVPKSLMESASAPNGTSPDWEAFPYLAVDEHDPSCLVVPQFLLAEGPGILASRSPEFTDMAGEIVTRAWKGLSGRLAALQKRRDPIFAWEVEEQLVHNVKALLNRCRQLEALRTLRAHTSLEQKVGLAGIAVLCERHSEFSAARNLYEWESDRQDPWTEAAFKLQLDIARVCERLREDRKVEDTYRGLFSGRYTGVPLDDVLTAYRQCASWLASRGKYSDAAKRLAEVLVVEDPWGGDAYKKAIRNSVTQLASYLVKTGNGAAASALLQRMLASLEDNRGVEDPWTLATREALSTVNQQDGELDQAYRHLSFVHDCQGKRLGDEHPTTVICWANMAAVLNLEGDQRRAESIYTECLRLAVRGLGPHHPSVFGIREKLAWCLLAQGKEPRARREFRALMDEIEAFRGMYPTSVRRRIGSFLDGKAMSYDDCDGGSHPKRSHTLGARDISDDEHDSGYTSDEWGK